MRFEGVVSMNKYGIQISKFTDGLEVLDSGIIHMTSSDIEFNVDNLKIKFIFTTDKNNSAPRYEGEVVGGVLLFKLYNFNNSLGEGPDAPIPIASIRNRELFILFYVNSNISTSNNSGWFREFKYTFFLRGIND